MASFASVVVDYMFCFITASSAAEVKEGGTSAVAVGAVTGSLALTSGIAGTGFMMKRLACNHPPIDPV